MTAVAPIPVPMRFTDGDAIRMSDDTTWVRGLRGTGFWGLSGATDTRSDRAILENLGSSEGWQLFPYLPSVGKSLPGTSLASREALGKVELRPAVGATLHTASLNRLQSAFGNESGVRRKAAAPVMSRGSVRASLESTLKRYPQASVAYHRFTGRLYARYRVESVLHTHVYVLMETPAERS